MLKYIIPRIALADVPPMILVSLVGGIIAGIYGILHDQITYSISPEYFTKLKFDQFRYADFGLGDRFFASTIGFLATCWVGFIAAWVLARRLIPNQPRDHAYRQIREGILWIMVFGLSFGIVGFGYGLWRGRDADYSSWTWAVRELRITDTWSFVRVAYIHNAGYLGGLIGLVVALVKIRPNRDQSMDTNSADEAEKEAPMTEAIFGHDRLDVAVECTAEIRRPMLLLWLPQWWIMNGNVVLHCRDEPANPRERRTTRGLKWNLVRQPPRDPRTTVMNPQLDSLIQRFRDAQDAGVRALTEQLRIPKPASNLEWATMCLDHKINRRCRLNEIDVHTHGYGVELKIGDLTIDFDWGENGEPDGFDAWRLYKFTLDNGGSDSYSHNRIQEWIDRSFAAGELTKSGTLYYDPKRRAKAPIQHANKSEISDERGPE